MPCRGLNYVHTPKRRYVHHEPQNVTDWNESLCRGKDLEMNHSRFGQALNPMISPEKRREGREEKGVGSRIMERWNCEGQRQGWTRHQGLLGRPVASKCRRGRKEFS